MRDVIVGLAALPAIGAATVAALGALGTSARPTLADEGRMPDLGGAIGWLNTTPLTSKSLRGKVVLVGPARRPRHHRATSYPGR